MGPMSEPRRLRVSDDGSTAVADRPSVAEMAPGAGDPRDPRMTAWHAFVTSFALVSRRLDEELRTEQGISLAEYDALVQLAFTPGRRLRMNQLADRVLLSRSGMTRLVDRLEADGLVERFSCPSDARGAEAVLTDAGLARLRSALTTHMRGVESYFLAALDAADVAVLERALHAVAEKAAPGARLEPCEAHAALEVADAPLPAAAQRESRGEPGPVATPAGSVAGG